MQYRGRWVILKSGSQKAWKWILIAAAVAMAAQFYYVREMLAALILLAVLFSCIAAAMLVLFLLDQAGGAMLGFLELQCKTVLQYAREWRSFSQPRSRS
jgi:hypothetical protein